MTTVNNPDGAINRAGRGLDEVKNAAKNEYKNVKEAAADKYDATVDAVKNRYDNAKVAAKAEYSAAKDAAASRYDNVVDAAKQQGKKVEKAVHDRAAETESGWNRIKARAEEMFDDARDFLDEKL